MFQLISELISKKMKAVLSSIPSIRNTDLDDGKVILGVPSTEEEQRWLDQAYLADRRREASPLSLTEDLACSKHCEVEMKRNWVWMRGDC
jgi:hypothetical protein